MKTHTIELFKGKGRQPFRFRVKAPNGETILTSESYPSASNRNRAVRSLIENLFVSTVRVVDLGKPPKK